MVKPFWVISLTALGRPIALAYVHRDFVEDGTTVSVLSDEQLLPAVVTRLPFVRG